MIIEEHEMILWEAIRRPNDLQRIAEAGKYSRSAISRALTTGECSKRLAETLRIFYEKRTEEVKQALTHYQNQMEKSHGNEHRSEAGLQEN